MRLDTQACELQSLTGKNGIHMNGMKHTYTKPSPPALFTWASIHVLPPDSQLTKSHWLTDWNNGCIKISDTCRYFSLVMCLFKRGLWRDATWDAGIQWMDGGRAGIVGVQKGWIIVHIQAQECISGHTPLPGKSLHKHFILNAAICFIALSVYCAQPCFLSGRICSVSLSGIDFFFFPPVVVWEGEEREGGDSSGEKVWRGKAHWISCACFFCKPPANIGILLESKMDAILVKAGRG